MGESFNLPDGRFAYITEIVEVPFEAKNGQIIKEKESEDWMKSHEEEIQELEEDLLEIDFNFDDLWAPNLGIKNGKIVCIDFE